MTESIPKVFIHEYLDGKPLYYKGYKKVQANPERIKEVRGVSGLHSILTTGLLNKLIGEDLRQQH